MRESEGDVYRFEDQTVVGVVAMGVLRQCLPFRMRMFIMGAYVMHVRLPAARMAMKMVVHGAVGVLVHMRVKRLVLLVRHGPLLCLAHRLYPL